MPNCAICQEPGTKVVDNIHLCADCNLTLQSGSRDTLMQTLGLLARLADQQKRIADLEAMLGTVVEAS